MTPTNIGLSSSNVRVIRYDKGWHLGGDRPEELGPHGPRGARPVAPAGARERVPRRRDRELHVLRRGRRDVAFTDRHHKQTGKTKTEFSTAPTAGC
jgi:hypothetical protein